MSKPVKDLMTKEYQRRYGESNTACVVSVIGLDAISTNKLRCALVTGAGSAIEIAKALVDLRKNYPKIELKVGILDGEPELISVEQLAKMKGRVELLGELAGAIRSPGARLAGCLAGPGGRIAGGLKALVDKGEKSAESAAAVPV